MFVCVCVFWGTGKTFRPPYTPLGYAHTCNDPISRALVTFGIRHWELKMHHSRG